MDNVANDVANDFSIPFSSVLLTNITEYKTDSAKNITARPEPVWQNFLWRNHVTWPNCTPLQESDPDLVDMLPIQLTFSVLYFTIWLFAIIGNLTVLYVVKLKHVTLSSVRSIFICSLAFSDILMSLTSLPITAVSIFTRDWVFPKPFCNMMFIQGGSVFVSSFTMTAIAVDRYILVRHPTSKIINVQNAICIVVSIWILGYTFALPVGIFSRAETYSQYCGIFCDEVWPDSDKIGISRMRTAYGLIVLFVQFVMPLLMSSLCYWKIGRIIDIQTQKRTTQHQIALQKNRERLQNRKNRTNRMMITMVFGLVLAWCPMNIINVWRDLNQGGEQTTWYTLVFALCHSVAMTSAVWNPVIYSFFNPQFKDTIISLWNKRRIPFNDDESPTFTKPNCITTTGKWLPFRNSKSTTICSSLSKHAASDIQTHSTPNYCPEEQRSSINSSAFFGKFENIKRKWLPFRRIASNSVDTNKPLTTDPESTSNDNVGMQNSPGNIISFSLKYKEKYLSLVDTQVSSTESDTFNGMKSMSGTLSTQPLLNDLHQGSDDCADVEI